MKAFWEIFRLEWRAATRSKALPATAVASLAWMICAPWVLVGDGFEFSVRYTLGIVFAVLLIALSASAAGSVAKERAGKRLQLTLARPVRSFTVALGRMAAFASMGSAVLAACAAVLWMRTPSRSCHHVIAPDMEPAEAVVDRAFAKYMAESQAFRESVERDGEGPYRRYLATHLGLVEDFQRIGPGSSTNWTFSAGSVSAGVPLGAEIRFMGMFGLHNDVRGVLRLGPLESAVDADSQRVLRIPLGTPASPAGADGKIRLEFANAGADALMVSPRRDVRLLADAGPFGMNLFRAWLQLSALLAFVVSLGVFLGSFLGRSVAVFTMMSFLFIMTLSPELMDEYPDPTGQDALDRICTRISELSASAASPFSSYRPIGLLVEDHCVEWPSTFRAVSVNAVLIPLLLSLLSGAAMRRTGAQD
ncbi:MAG: hypothetical protein K6F50_04910 [Kiritimatiellae bacterium]|nr:hypothetical protein [Kiritimatiellia bacterium]